eukprot:2875411-Prymnesium_polylepis.2
MRPHGVVRSPTGRAPARASQASVGRAITCLGGESPTAVALRPCDGRGGLPRGMAAESPHVEPGLCGQHDGPAGAALPRCSLHLFLGVAARPDRRRARDCRAQAERSACAQTAHTCSAKSCSARETARVCEPLPVRDGL